MPPPRLFQKQNDPPRARTGLKSSLFFLKNANADLQNSLDGVKLST